jgi:Yip1-like protein
MANGVADSISPFFSIWTEPRATIRRIADSDPTRHVLTLAAIGPALNSLISQWSAVINGTAHPSVLWPLWVAFNVVIQAAFGILFLYIFAAVFRWSGSVLGGTATNVEVRAALAWSQVPAILGEIILLFALFAGVPMPKIFPGRLPLIDPAFYKVMVAEGVIGIWGFVISLKCVGEVHRFSAWRAFVAILIPPLIALVIVGLGVFLFASIAGKHN